MFATSTQSKFWVFETREDVNKLKHEAIMKFMELQAASNKAISQEVFIAIDQQNLLVGFYEHMLYAFCSQFEPPMPNSVKATAVLYLKRVYLKHAAMDFHPKDLITTCVFLAAKVDEFNVSLRRFVANLKRDRDKVSEMILWFELPLMSALDFHLTVHTAYRPLEGLFINLKTHMPEINIDSLRPAAADFLEKALFTDAYLLSAPSQIALAALKHSSEAQHLNLRHFIHDSLMHGSTSEQIEHVLKKIAEIRNLVSSVSKPAKSEVKAIEKRLELCRNPQNNPNSTLFQRMMKRVDDDDDEEQLDMYRQNSQEQVQIEEELLNK